VQAEGGPDEDPSGGFDHGGWFVAHKDDEVSNAIVGWFTEADAFLLGRESAAQLSRVNATQQRPGRGSSTARTGGSPPRGSVRPWSMARLALQTS
jgi:hypothetical protein